MATNPIDLTELASVKAWLGITDSSQDVLLQQLITAGSAFILSVLNRPTLSVAAYDEWYDAGVKNFLMLRNWPVVSVASIQHDGWEVTTPATGNPPASGFQIDPGESGQSQARLIVHGHRFNGCRSSVRIQYSAGYASVPYDLAQVAVELIGEKKKARERIGVRQKSLPNGENVSFNLSGLSVDSRATLMNYARVTPG